MAQAYRDQNNVPTLIASSNVDGFTPIRVYADPVTHRLLVDSTGGGTGTVTSVGTGTGLTGGPITTTGTISLDSKLAPLDTLGTAGQLIRVNAGATALEYFTSGGGTGTVTSVSVATANGFAGTVANATTTPVITLTTSITGILKGNGTAISAGTTGDVDPILPTQTGNSGKFLTTDGTNSSWGTPAGSGDVVGPGSSTDNAVARFDGTTGKLIQNSAVTISDTLGDITAGKYNTVAITGTSTPVISVTGTANISGTNTGDQTNITGNAGTATALQTGRTIAITGDLTYTSPSFNGTSNITAAGTLATVNSNVGSFTNASITVNGKGLITAASNGSGGGGITWTEVTTTSQTASINNGYITNNGSLVTVTLPSTAAVGSVVRVAGSGAGGWKIAQNASGQINFGNTATTSGTGGFLSSNNRYDAVELICITANNIWTVISSQGDVTVS